MTGGLRHSASITQPLFAFAHLALCAAAILARPSALIFLRSGLDVAVAFELTGRPRFGVVVWPFNRARACSRREISASMVWIIADVSMVRL